MESLARFTVLVERRRWKRLAAWLRGAFPRFAKPVALTVATLSFAALSSASSGPPDGAVASRSAAPVPGQPDR